MYNAIWLVNLIEVHTGNYSKSCSDVKMWSFRIKSITYN